MIIREAFVFVAFLATLPFILLIGMGWMKPAEGFCLENGMAQDGDPPSPEEAARSYFVSPELGYRYEGLTDNINWPICIRSRRGMHRFWAGGRDRDLARLREPNLSQLHQAVPGARVFRVLTHASFSPLPIAFRLEMNETGGGVLHAAWLDDDARETPRVDPSAIQASLDAREDWLKALALQTSAQRLSETDARALWSLLDEATPRESIFRPAIDGNWLVIEAIENGERTVRFVWLAPPPYPTGRLLCALAAQAEMPARALEQGLTRNPCASSA